MINYEMTVAIGRKKADPGPLIKQHDSGVNFTVRLIVCRYETDWLEEEDPYSIPEGCTAVLKVQKPDSTCTMTDAEVRYPHSVYAELPVEATAAVGICKAEISIYDRDGERITSATFDYEVEKEAVSGDSKPSQDYFDVLGQQVKSVKEAAETAADAAEKALSASVHPPILSDDDTWLVWDQASGKYVDTGIYSGGNAPHIGDNGNWFVGGNDTGVSATGPSGPVGPTPQISVTVTTLPAGQDVTVQVSGPAEAPTIAFGIPQGEPGERGPQGLQGFQGWGLSGAELDSDGALVLTLRNPADGQTQTMPPVPIDNSAALQAVAAAITAQGTTQVQRVEDAGDDAVGAVSTAKDAALEAVGQAQTAATGAVSSAQTTAVQAVQDAQGTATTAISQAQTDAVGAVDAAKTDALESVGALVQQAEDAAIRQPIISDHDTWMIWDAASGQYVDTGLYAGGQAPYIGEDGYWYVGTVKTDTLAQGPAGPAGAGVPSTEGIPTDYLLSPAGWVAPPSGGGNTWKLIRDITLAEDVKSINIETDSVGLPFSCDEIYINTNATNAAEQTVATSLMFRINGKNTVFIGTTAPMSINGGKNGETGRNWAWVRSINPLIVLTGTWITTNTASGKTVYCYQPNDINSDDISSPAITNPYDIGEKISDIEIAGALSTSFFSAGSRFLVYGR